MEYALVPATSLVDLVNNQNWNEQIQHAIHQGSAQGAEIAERLLSARPAIDKKDAALAALINAIHQSDTRSVKFLVRHADMATTIDGEHTALLEGAKQGDVGIVRDLLLHANVSEYIDVGDGMGWTALHWAAKDGQTEIMEELIKNGADIDAADDRHQTPLHVVVFENEHFGAVEFLLDFEAEVNTKDAEGDSPLHEAVKHNDRKLVEILLRYGADPDIVNVNGESARDLTPRHEVDRVGDLFAVVEPLKTERPAREPSCTGERADISREFRGTVHFYYERKSKASWVKTEAVWDLVYSDRVRELEEEYIQYLMDTHKVMVVEEDRQHIWNWIHFPATNMTWVKDLILRLTNGSEDKEQTWTFFQENIQERRQEGLAGCTRMPDVKDSRRYALKKDHDAQTQTGKSVQNLETIAETPTPPMSDAATSPHPALTPQGSTSSETGGKTAKGKKKATKKEDSASLFKKGEKPGSEGWRGIKTTFPADRKLSLVFPYVDFETEYYISRDDPHASNTEHELQKPQFRRMRELERLYAPYKGISGVQSAQTLDETYYWMLGREKLRDRDRDQVIYKWTRSRIGAGKRGPTPGKSGKRSAAVSRSTTEMSKMPKITFEPSATVTTQNGPSPTPVNRSRTGSLLSEPPRVRRSFQSSRALKGTKEMEIPKAVPMLLTIHQLWLWKIDGNTVISAFPERWHTGSQDTLFDTIRQSGLRDFSRPEQLIAHILHQCARFLDMYRYAGFGQHILDIFETEIARLSDEEATMFQVFQRSLEDGIFYNIDREILSLCELKDIQDELHLLRRVFENQRDVLEKFALKFWHGGQDNWKQVRQQFNQDSRIDTLMKRVSTLDEEAQRTQDSLDYLIQTKQAQGGLQEAEAAGKLNNYIMLFTVVTIVFTPLSFLTALFAIPLDTFSRNPDSGELELETGWFTGRMFAGELGSLALILLGVWMYWIYVERRTKKQIQRRQHVAGTLNGNLDGPAAGTGRRGAWARAGQSFLSGRDLGLGGSARRRRGGGRPGGQRRDVESQA